MNGNSAMTDTGFRPLLPHTTQNFTPHRLDTDAQRVWELTEAEDAQDLFVGPTHITEGHQAFKVTEIIRILRAHGSDLAR